MTFCFSVFVFSFQFLLLRACLICFVFCKAICNCVLKGAIQIKFIIICHHDLRQLFFWKQQLLPLMRLPQLLQLSYIRTREYSSLKEEQRTTLRAFLGGKDVLAILSTDISKSLIKLLVPMMIALSNCWFSKPVMDRWVVQSPVKYLFKVPACFQTVSSSAVIRWFCITNRPLNLVPNQPSKPSLNLQTVL